VSSEPESLFNTKTVTIGDIQYVVRELTGKEHDDCTDLARVEVSPEHPNGVDGQLMLKFMAEKAIEPHLGLAEINNLPFTKRAALFDAVNDVHYPGWRGPEPVGKAENA
jgi:hypothetical protein